MQNRSLSTHPLVLFGCFAAVLGFAMFLMHPLCLLLSLGGALGCLASLGSGRALLSASRAALPAAGLTLAVAALFNHRGETILFYLPGGNACTVESLCYAAAAAALLTAVLLWFSCCTKVLTSDHFLYLFSRVSPALALLFSMTLRFLPLFRQRFSAVRAIQTAPKGKLQRCKGAFFCFFAVVAWALEHAGETADSMKARGYALRGRTVYAVTELTTRDRLLLFGLCSLAVCTTGACAAGLFSFTYAPRLMLSPWSAAHTCAFFGYALLCAYPALILKLEALPWRCSKRKI